MHEPAACQNPNAACLAAAIDGLSSRDPDAVVACLSEDGFVELPFERRVPTMDRRSLHSFLEMLFSTYRRFSLELTHVYELTDPNTLIARYEGDCIGFDDVPYKNSYISIFGFEDGRISSWREYDNPMVSSASQRAHAEARESSAQP
jgi:ketosteroid isomerase-like protein